MLQFFKLFLTWCIIFNMGNGFSMGSPKIELSNATNMGLKAEVIYDVEKDPTVSSRKTDTEVDLDTSVGITTGVKLGPRFKRLTDKKFNNDADKKEKKMYVYDIDPHASKKIYLETRMKTGVAYIKVTREEDGVKVETLNAIPGNKLILIPIPGNKIRVEPRKRDWESKKGQDYDPHQCLKKGEQCRKCGDMTEKDGKICQMKEKHFYIAVDGEDKKQCPVCDYVKPA